MKIYQLSPEEALASLNSSQVGLSQTDVEHRLDECGPNRVEDVHGESLVFAFIKEFSHFFALISTIPTGVIAFLVLCRLR